MGGRAQEPHDQGARDRGGLAALEELVAAGVNANVTLIFSERQYVIARDACWRGLQRRKDRDSSRPSTASSSAASTCTPRSSVPELSPRRRGMVGIVNAKHIWQLESRVLGRQGPQLQQEMIFASTGTKKPADPPWKYVEAFAGSDIETNPPATNKAVQESGRTITRMVDQLPPADVLEEIDEKVDIRKLEETLMKEGIAKFADPQKALLKLIAEKRAALK